MVKARRLVGLRALLVLSGLGLLSGCGKGDEGSSASAVSELRSELPRVTPDLAEALTAAKSEQDFAFSFLQALDADTNLVFSPHSLSSAFAMLTDAADGQTLDEIATVLHFGTVDDAFHRSQDALGLGLFARNRDAINNDSQQVEAQILTQSNDVWIRDDLPPEPSYLDTLARYYGVGVHHADFPNRPEAARTAINQKIAHDTHDLIPELLAAGSVTPDTLSVLTNALYFKAPWEQAFGPASKGDFHALDGTSVSADMMPRSDYLEYYAGESFVSVGVPYYGNDLQMLLIVPDAGSYDLVRSKLSSDVVSEIVAHQSPLQVNLTLPKFKVRSSIAAKSVLETLGMTTPFTPGVASFPKLSADPHGVYVDDVVHEATVTIDEKGTEAAAATAILTVTLGVAIPEEPQVVTVDRPFLFVIRDNSTSSVLFVGQVVAP